ncbi:hypothetical protein BLNAU_916 [Blattamonas nauphoetae]|uniref:F-box domain-containing protein n=1 Tax=Blattamonas nauphoetae TaxID=2049346 RepID=A0ABQ9YL56_9EUKA|nr:hypothetical protein BLNAU_916 [Blattamonas nauphoetae]
MTEIPPEVDPKLLSLPPDVILNILSYFGPSSLLQIGWVPNKLLRSLSEDPTLWIVHTINQWAIPYTSEHTDWKRLYWTIYDNWHSGTALRSDIYPPFHTQAIDQSNLPSPSQNQGHDQLSRIEYPDFVTNDVIIRPPLLYCASNLDPTIHVWDLDTEELLFLMEDDCMHTRPVTCLDYDDYQLISGSEDKTVKRWDLDTHSVYGTCTGKAQVISDVSIDGEGVVVGVGWEGVMDVWRGKGRPTLSFLASGPIQSVAQVQSILSSSPTSTFITSSFSSDHPFQKQKKERGTHYAAGCWDGKILLFDIAQGESIGNSEPALATTPITTPLLSLFHQEACVSSLIASQFQVISSSWNGSIDIYDSRLPSVRMATASAPRPINSQPALPFSFIGPPSRYHHGSLFSADWNDDVAFRSYSALIQSPLQPSFFITSLHPAPHINHPIPPSFTSGPPLTTSPSSSVPPVATIPSAHSARIRSLSLLNPFVFSAGDDGVVKAWDLRMAGRCLEREALKNWKIGQPKSNKRKGRKKRKDGDEDEEEEEETQPSRSIFSGIVDVSDSFIFDLSVEDDEENEPTSNVSQAQTDTKPTHPKQTSNRKRTAMWCIDADRTRVVVGSNDKREFVQFLFGFAEDEAAVVDVQESGATQKRTKESIDFNGNAAMHFQQSFAAATGRETTTKREKKDEVRDLDDSGDGEENEEEAEEDSEEGELPEWMLEGMTGVHITDDQAEEEEEEQEEEEIVNKIPDNDSTPSTPRQNPTLNASLFRSVNSNNSVLPSNPSVEPDPNVNVDHHEPVVHVEIGLEAELVETKKSSLFNPTLSPVAESVPTHTENPGYNTLSVTPPRPKKRDTKTGLSTMKVAEAEMGEMDQDHLDDTQSYREKLLNYLSLLAPGAASQSSLVDEQDALDLTSDVHKFLTALIKQTSDLLHDTYVDDSFTNYMSDPPSLIPSAMSQSGFDENLSQQLTFKAVSEQESCPLMFGLPPYLTPSTVPLSLTVPSFNLYAFTIPNFTHSTEYDSYVESPSFMTPPFPFKFKLRVWPKGFAQADSPTDIGAAIVLQKGFSRNVEEFAPKLFPTRTTPDTATNTVQNLYTFDLRIEMLSEYPEKAKQSVQFPFRKQKTQECKIGKGSGWTSFIKKQEVVDGRLMWKENMAAHFLFGWRFPNYKRMTEAYHLSYIEQNQYLIPEDDSIN